MELLLIRHALPIRREVTEGAADPPLSSDGVRQAELLGEYLASEHIDAVYASPLLRAVQTADPLCRMNGCEMTLDAGLAEFDQHSSEYIPVEELKAFDLAGYGFSEELSKGNDLVFTRKQED